MKNKVVNIVMGVVLVISVVGNVYMVKLFSDTKEDAVALRNQIAAADDQIVDLEGQLTNFAQVQGHVADLQGQLTDFEKVQTEVADLQKQLTESKDLIESLESTITEQNITVASLEEQWENQEQLLLEARANAKKTAQNSNGGGQSSSGSKSSINPGLVKEPDGSMHPQVGHRWDDNNPNFPVYEGPKEGYAWNNALGYLPWDGGTGVEITGEMNSDKRPCEYDENGNCTVHQHSGY